MFSFFFSLSCCLVLSHYMREPLKFGASITIPFRYKLNFLPSRWPSRDSNQPREPYLPTKL